MITRADDEPLWCKPNDAKLYKGATMRQLVLLGLFLNEYMQTFHASFLKCCFCEVFWAVCARPRLLGSDLLLATGPVTHKRDLTPECSDFSGLQISDGKLAARWTSRQAHPAFGAWRRKCRYESVNSPWGRMALDETVLAGRSAPETF